jgi:hypothetical protein
VPRQLTLELPDSMAEALEQAAARSGQTVQEWVVARLRPHAMTPAEWAAARERILRFAGAAGPGDFGSGDAASIDADLARSYDDPHEPCR